MTAKKIDATEYTCNGCLTTDLIENKALPSDWIQIVRTNSYNDDSETFHFCYKCADKFEKIIHDSFKD